jgi:hypothetical protein
VVEGPVGGHSEVADVRGLIGWLGAFLAGSAGWWLGAKVGFATGVLLSAVAAGVGMYAAYRWFDRNLG